jgi:hypothetical protein
VVLPGVGGTFHHSKSSIVPLIIMAVQEDELGPQMSLLTSADYCELVL